MDYRTSYDQWSKSDELTALERQRLSSMTEEEKKDAFCFPLAFGTAGMRGVLDLGTNKMNRFTVRRATKGLAEYVSALGEDAKRRGVVISYDTRRFSHEFALECARTLSQNKVRTYLFEGPRPVPFCSFAIRHLGAIAGVMITASHNPKVYNGYKVYGEDGAQMSPEATEEVVKYIDATPYFGVKTAPIEEKSTAGLDGAKLDEFVTVIGRSVDEEYFDVISRLSLSPDAVKKCGKDIKIVYTPVHGSGYMPVTEILSRMGITVNVVAEQALPDPEFSTVRVPNPEEADTLQLGVSLAKKIGSDVVIGTDPDADRMGVAVKDEKGEFKLLNGNQIGVLLLDYILRRKKECGTLPKNGAVVKTIVTTELARLVANDYGVTTFDVLTGFKFIGEKIKEWEESGEYVYLFGFEESYGSLVGTHARDKDAVVAAMTFAEMVCYYKTLGMTVYDALMRIYAKYGCFAEKAKSVTFGGVDGMKKMADIMQKLREEKFDIVEGKRALSVSDFVKRIERTRDCKETPISLPKTNALKILLEGGDWICARPSGTEPKLKFYAAASAETLEEAGRRAEAYLAYMAELAK